MTPYEVMFILRPDIEGEALDEQVERYRRLIADNGGEVLTVDKWGKRRFAYEIKGLTEGYYVVIQFRAGAAVVAELNRILRIADEIVRHIIVKLDESQVAKPAAEAPESESQLEPEDRATAEAAGQPEEAAQPATP